MMAVNVIAVLPKACLKQPCGHGGTCHGDDNDFYCECPEEYFGVYCEGKYVIFSKRLKGCVIKRHSIIQILFQM